ncbi:uncharacterized protein [Misgurnus anguillicaudatus]|uniref:uncharacterized protein n=1 Tax=Misgurnus anguillicaudatus TaxID=75329 RepID=UPI003CCF945E
MDGFMEYDAGLAGETRIVNETGLSGGTRTVNDSGLAGETSMANNNGLAGKSSMVNDNGLAGETSTVNDNELADGTCKANDSGLDKRLRAGNERNHKVRNTFCERIYLKEATVIVNVENINEVRAEDIIKAVTEQCGHGKILALRPRQGKEYELTMEMEEDCDKLIDGLTVKGVECEVKNLHNRDYVVSFMHLPAYLDDCKILEKLYGWGVEPLTKIKRRRYPGTDIEDGTRFLKVRLPKEVASLPYSTRLETVEGLQHFRVMHSHQVKTCRLCMSPDHLLKDCPNFKCYKCKEPGHFAKHCNAVRCTECQEYLYKCECWMEEEEGGGEQAGGQVHEGKNNADEETDGGQEDKELHQRETEETISNEEKGDNGKENEEMMEQDNPMMGMKISGVMEDQQSNMDQNKETDCEEETKINNIDRELRGHTRRRTVKVKPNLNCPRKKTKGNKFDVLRGLEEENDK